MLLEKLLQSQGFGSRKHCQQLIRQGAVAVAGETLSNPKQNLESQDLCFEVFGQQYQYREKVYIALHKASGYECSHQATHHFSVFDLFDSVLLQRGLQCVGRLDQDTSGLLLLTDDGQFLQALTHPKKHVPKRYRAVCADPIDAAQIMQLQQGVALHQEKGLFAATDIALLSPKQIELTIHQGVYHQVKRMLAAVGNRVMTLHRVQVGQLQLQHLAAGEWCYLDATQIAAAKNTLKILSLAGSAQQLPAEQDLEQIESDQQQYIVI